MRKKAAFCISFFLIFLSGCSSVPDTTADEKEIYLGGVGGIYKIDSGKEVMTQVSSGSYDLKIIDNMLVISEESLGEYSFETTFQTYTLDDNGNLTSDTPQDIYAQYELPEGYEDGMRFLILPIFTTKYFGYSCFIKSIGEIDINSIWIRKGDEKSAKEVVTCSGTPLVTKDRIFYCDSNEHALMQHDFDDAQETALY